MSNTANIGDQIINNSLNITAYANYTLSIACIKTPTTLYRAYGPIDQNPMYKEKYSWFAFDTCSIDANESYGHILGTWTTSNQLNILILDNHYDNFKFLECNINNHIHDEEEKNKLLDALETNWKNGRNTVRETDKLVTECLFDIFKNNSKIHGIGTSSVNGTHQHHSEICILRSPDIIETLVGKPNINNLYRKRKCPSVKKAENPNKKARYNDERVKGKTLLFS